MRTPSRWTGPVFLMNFPLSISNRVANNVLMQPDVQGPYNHQVAGQQWLSLYRALSEEGLVYVLPGHDNLQDLPFVANIGCYLPHIKHDDVMLVANFTSEPRKGEDKIGWSFFSKFDYRVNQPPYCWEGEADLKWIRDNVYVGGIGSRSTSQAFDWMRDNFEMDITEVRISDPKLYHLDCVFFPLTEEKALVNVSVLESYDLHQLENLVEVIPVPRKYAYEGWTNSVRLGDTLLHAPARLPTKPFSDLLEKHDFGLTTFDLSEFDKSGADLSCLVMHMNYHARY